MTTTHWVCSSCGISNYWRKDKLPCLCGQPQPEVMAETKEELAT